MIALMAAEQMISYTLQNLVGGEVLGEVLGEELQNQVLKVPNVVIAPSALPKTRMVAR